MAVSATFRSYLNKIVNTDIRRALEAVMGVSGTLTPADLAVVGNETVGGTLTVTGTSTFTGAQSLVGGFQTTAHTVTPDAVSSAAATILPNTRNVTLAANVNDANDWFVLPAIASVPMGHTIVIVTNAAANCEMRTPASSTTTINAQNSDGTKEYLCTGGDVVVVTKNLSTGWIGTSYTSLGAVRAAVVPD